MSDFERGTRLLDDGTAAECYGFLHKGVFIYDPTVSECGRFEVKPEYYGLTQDEANALIEINKGRLNERQDFQDHL